MQDTAHPAEAPSDSARFRPLAFVPGALAAIVVGAAAHWLAGVLGVPPALAVAAAGLAASPAAAWSSLKPGLDFVASVVLRCAIILLGFKISLDQIVSLGVEPLLLIAATIALGITFAVFMARRFNLGAEFGLIAGMAVAICGVSAALAAATLVPRSRDVERDVLYVALSVTLLSTVAMVLYPLIGHEMGLSDSSIGVFLGATIHDLAQVIGAGYGVSTAAGDAAIITKLARVSMLAPCMVAAAVLLRLSRPERRLQALPWFIVAFLAVVAMNSTGAIPAKMAEILGGMSGYLFLASLSAICMKIKWKDLVIGDWRRAALIVSHTALLAGLVAGCLLLIGS